MLVMLSPFYVRFETISRSYGYSNCPLFVSQCIPDGVTLEDIRADPEWASPLCREFLHPSMQWDPAYFEAVIVNLKLNFTVNYLGEPYWKELVTTRTAAGIPTFFYGFTPDVLVERVNGTHGKVRVKSVGARAVFAFLSFSRHDTVPRQAIRIATRSCAFTPEYSRARSAQK
eukprot:2823818-Pyramimonas_sp.AAC.1